MQGEVLDLLLIHPQQRANPFLITGLPGLRSGLPDKARASSKVRDPVCSGLPASLALTMPSALCLATLPYSALGLRLCEGLFLVASLHRDLMAAVCSSAPRACHVVVPMLSH